MGCRAVPCRVSVCAVLRCAPVNAPPTRCQTSFRHRSWAGAYLSKWGSVEQHDAVAVGLGLSLGFCRCSFFVLLHAESEVGAEGHEGWQSGNGKGWRDHFWALPRTHCPFPPPVPRSPETPFSLSLPPSQSWR